MKSSNSRNATPPQYLEYLRIKRGLRYAKQKRDELGWFWHPAVLAWTIKQSWCRWIIVVLSLVATILGMLVDWKALFPNE